MDNLIGIRQQVSDPVVASNQMRVYVIGEYDSPAFVLPSGGGTEIYWYTDTGTKNLTGDDDDAYNNYYVLDTVNFDIFTGGPETQVGRLPWGGITSGITVISDYYNDGRGYTYGFMEIFDRNSFTSAGAGEHIIWDAYKDSKIRFELWRFNSFAVQDVLLRASEEVLYGEVSTIIPASVWDTVAANESVRAIIERWDGASWVNSHTYTLNKSIGFFNTMHVARRTSSGDTSIIVDSALA